MEGERAGIEGICKKKGTMVCSVNQTQRPSD